MKNPYEFVLYFLFLSTHCVGSFHRSHWRLVDSSLVSFSGSEWRLLREDYQQSESRRTMEEHLVLKKCPSLLVMPNVRMEGEERLEEAKWKWPNQMNWQLWCGVVIDYPYKSFFIARGEHFHSWFLLLNKVSIWTHRVFFVMARTHCVDLYLNKGQGQIDFNGSNNN